MLAAAWSAQTDYLRQALRKLREPSAPEPDIALLAGNERSPFAKVWVGTDPETGEPAVYFTIRNPQRGPRYGPPEVFLILSLLLAYGGGLSVNDNGTGWAGLRPWGGVLRHMLGRILTGSRAGQRAKQNPKADHHAQDPLRFTKVGRPVAAVEKAMGRPYRDREDAIQTALGYYDRNHHRAAFRVSRAEYEQILRDCLRLIDAYFGDDVV